LSKRSFPRTSRLELAASESKHDVFQAIADPTRRKILRLLADKEMPIASIVERFPISRTAVNKHLQVLSDAGLVSRRRIGRETRYKAQPQPLAKVKQWLAFFEQYWDEKLSALKDYVECEDE
jgi:DNA-binding transcriptional ArsR family regulator